MMLAHLSFDETDATSAPVCAKHVLANPAPEILDQVQAIDEIRISYVRISNEGQRLMLDDTVPDLDLLIRERLVVVEWRGDFIYADAIEAEDLDTVLEHLARRGVGRGAGERLIAEYNRFVASVDALHAAHMTALLDAMHGDMPDTARVAELRALNLAFRERFSTLGGRFAQVRMNRPRTLWTPVGGLAAPN
ncbi:MAG: hypothetical protein ACK50Q_06215 [Labrys sp. (in: a-proteobacteria)]